MLPVLRVGPLALRVPGLVWLAGLYLGLTWSAHWARRRQGLSPAHLENLVWGAGLAGLVTGRVGFFLAHPVAWRGWGGLFSLDAAVFDPFLAALGGLAFALGYAQRRRLPGWPLLDALTPLLVVLALALGLVWLAQGAFYGPSTPWPWGMPVGEVRHHPLALYWLLGVVPLALDLWGLSRAPGGRDAPRLGLLPRGGPEGMVFLTAVAWLALLLLVLAAWRMDGPRWPGGVRPEQGLAWLALAGAVFGVRRCSARQEVDDERPAR